MKFTQAIYCETVNRVPSLFEIDFNRILPDSPRQLKIEIITPQLACFLNSVWHSLLPRLHFSNIFRSGQYICFGAHYRGQWYAVGIWSSPVARFRIFDKNQILELRRLAISPAAPKYTASFMISQMIKIIKRGFPNVKRLVSYQDTEAHTGTIYKASNWQIGCKIKGGSWSRKKRKRNPAQTLADKIRWEFYLR